METPTGTRRSADGVPAGDTLSPREVRQMTVGAGEMVGLVVRTTLGPQGMDKLFVDSDGMSLVTNSGASILKEQVSHPIADMLVDAVIAQEEEVTDGTTSTAIIASALLSEAGELLERGLHPTTILRGFTTARREARTRLQDLARPVNPDDDARLAQVAATAMTGKGVREIEDTLAELVVETVRHISDDRGVDTDNVRLMKSRGGRVDESHVLDGVVLEKERLTPDMPFSVEDAGVVIVEDAVDFSDADSSPDAMPTDIDELDRFIDHRTDQVRERMDHLSELGVGAVICADTVEDPFPRALARRDIYAVKRVTPEDVTLLARTTGATPVADLADVEEAHVGYASAAFERTIDGESKSIVEGVAEGTAATLVLRGVSRNLVDELARASQDALEAVRVVLTDRLVLPGGGATEVELARSLRDRAVSEPSRQQLAIEAFADALETIPMTLAENAGRSSLDALLDLRTHHDAGDATVGLGAPHGECVDMVETGVVEPLQVKTRVVENATDAASVILRIDGILPSTTDADGTDER